MSEYKYKDGSIGGYDRMHKRIEQPSVWLPWVVMALGLGIALVGLGMWSL